MIAVLARAGGIAPGTRMVLEEEEARHVAVRRAKDGEAVTVLDGAGTRGYGRLARWADGFVVDIERVAQDPLPPSVTLAVGAGDRDRFALVAEQAAQFGATRIVPVESERTRAVATRLRDSHLDRIRRRAREALKQCGASWEPEIAPPAALELVLPSLGPGERWLADHAGQGPPALGPETPLTILVGPEGGFTAAERDLALQAGFVPVRVGPHILRFDTAALAALSTAWQVRQRGAHG